VDRARSSSAASHEATYRPEAVLGDLLPRRRVHRCHPGRGVTESSSRLPRRSVPRLSLPS
jgi:hypothetical protein